MSRYLLVLNALMFACALAVTGHAAAQDHSAHATPPGSGHDHSQHETAKPKQDAPEANTADDPSVGHDVTDHGQMDHSRMHHDTMHHQSMDNDTMDHTAMDHSTMDHSAMGHDMAASQTPITPIPEVTDADRVAAFPVLTQHMEHAPEINHYVALNHLEAWDTNTGSGQAWEAIGWIGSDLNRLWVRSDGERVDGRTETAGLELLYGRSITPWWDVVMGIKHDFQPDGAQSWAGMGFQGLAPYQFEVQATAYVSDSGQSQIALDVEYDLLFTNRLILQPVLDVQLFGKDDPTRGIGSGLSTLETGLRLRYEISRKFAPYIGLVHERAFGNTADFRQARGEQARDTRFVAGVRIWF